MSLQNISIEKLIDTQDAKSLDIPVTVVLKLSWQILQFASPIKFFISLNTRKDKLVRRMSQHQLQVKLTADEE